MVAILCHGCDFHVRVNFLVTSIVDCWCQRESVFLTLQTPSINIKYFLYSVFLHGDTSL